MLVDEVHKTFVHIVLRGRINGLLDVAAEHMTQEDNDRLRDALIAEFAPLPSETECRRGDDGE